MRAMTSMPLLSMPLLSMPLLCRRILFASWARIFIGAGGCGGGRRSSDNATTNAHATIAISTASPSSRREDADRNNELTEQPVEQPVESLSGSTSREAQVLEWLVRQRQRTR